jgi:hypothetical protein
MATSAQIEANRENAQKSSGPQSRKAEIGFVSQKAAEAEETRRAATENRKTEHHTLTIEIKKQRLEREKYKSMMAAVKAGDKVSKELPPNWQQLLAA